MAAVMNAKTEQGKLFAQFGKNSDEQHAYFNAVMNLMFEQKNSERAKQFNYRSSRNPLPPNSLYSKDFDSYVYGTKRW